MKTYLPQPSLACGLLCCAMVISTAGCTDLKTPVAANVAVATAAVNDALNAGSSEFAPVETRQAREKLAMADKGFKDHDFIKADSFAKQALAEAKLAMSKVHTAKAEAEVAELQNDIEILQEQIKRANQ